MISDLFQEYSYSVLHSLYDSPKFRGFVSCKCSKTLPCLAKGNRKNVICCNFEEFQPHSRTFQALIVKNQGKKAKIRNAFRFFINDNFFYQKTKIYTPRKWYHSLALSILTVDLSKIDQRNKKTYACYYIFYVIYYLTFNKIHDGQAIVQRIRAHSYTSILYGI